MPNTESKPVSVPTNPEHYAAAVSKGMEMIAGGGSKADAARAIYEMLIDECREVIIQAFIDGATVTEKGSPTYFYNVRRQNERKQREAERNVASKPKGKKKDATQES